jgi:hypothetical protein
MLGRRQKTLLVVWAALLLVLLPAISYLFAVIVGG